MSQSSSEPREGATTTTELHEYEYDARSGWLMRRRRHDDGGPQGWEMFLRSDEFTAAGTLFHLLAYPADASTPAPSHTGKSLKSTLSSPDATKPVLGPVRCICDDGPLAPFIPVNGGIWGSLACRRCSRLLSRRQHEHATPCSRAREAVRFAAAEFRQAIACGVSDPRYISALPLLDALTPSSPAATGGASAETCPVVLYSGDVRYPAESCGEPMPCPFHPAVFVPEALRCQSCGAEASHPCHTLDPALLNTHTFDPLAAPAGAPGVERCTCSEGLGAVVHEAHCAIHADGEPRDDETSETQAERDAALVPAAPAGAGTPGVEKRMRLSVTAVLMRGPQYDTRLIFDASEIREVLDSLTRARQSAEQWEQAVRQQERESYAAANSLDVAELDASVSNLALENAVLAARLAEAEAAREALEQEMASLRQAKEAAHVRASRMREQDRETWERQIAQSDAAREAAEQVTEDALRVVVAWREERAVAGAGGFLHPERYRALQGALLDLSNAFAARESRAPTREEETNG